MNEIGIILMMDDIFDGTVQIPNRDEVLKKLPAEADCLVRIDYLTEYILSEIEDMYYRNNDERTFEEKSQDFFQITPLGGCVEIGEYCYFVFCH